MKNHSTPPFVREDILNQLDSDYESQQMDNQYIYDNATRTKNPITPMNKS